MRVLDLLALVAIALVATPVTAQVTCGESALAMPNKSSRAPKTESLRPAILMSAEAKVQYPTRTTSIKGAIGAGCTEGFSDVTPEKWVGSTGFASCVGLIIRWPSPSRILVAHFNTENDPAASLEAFSAAHAEFKIADGVSVYLAGGDDSPESNALLKNLIDAFVAKGVTGINYVPRSSFAVNGNGELAVNLMDTPADKWIPNSAGAAALNETIEKARAEASEKGRAARERALRLAAQIGNP